MPSYHLEDEFHNPQFESLALRFLVEGKRTETTPFRAEQFVSYKSVFEALEAALVNRKPLDAVDGLYEAIAASTGVSGQSLESVSKELSRLLRLRLLARFQEASAAQLFGGQSDPDQILAFLETSVNQLRRHMSPGEDPPLSAAHLALQVARTAASRAATRKESGQSIHGIPTGLARLDNLLNGFTPGLHVLAAGPGAGKTTLCLQWALHAASQGHPVVYVTYENSPANLALKLLASRSEQSSTQVERGFANLEALERACAELEPALSRITFVPGTRRTALSAVQQHAVSASSHGGLMPLLVFDYLQRAAHGLGYEQLRHNVSAMAAELREISNRLDCPVIAISSQNRAQGDYSRGGRPSLDSLKESGDLEYAADSVLVLHPREGTTVSEPARAMELSLLKNRFGPLGRLNLVFRADIGIFREES